MRCSMVFARFIHDITHTKRLTASWRKFCSTRRDRALEAVIAAIRFSPAYPQGQPGPEIVDTPVALTLEVNLHQMIFPLKKLHRPGVLHRLHDLRRPKGEALASRPRQRSRKCNRRTDVLPASSCTHKSSSMALSKKKRRLAAPCPGWILGGSFDESQRGERRRSGRPDVGPDEEVIQLDGHAVS